MKTYKFTVKKARLNTVLTTLFINAESFDESFEKAKSFFVKDVMDKNVDGIASHVPYHKDSDGILYENSMLLDSDMVININTELQGLIEVKDWDVHIFSSEIVLLTCNLNQKWVEAEVINDKVVLSTDNLTNETVIDFVNLKDYLIFSLQVMSDKLRICFVRAELM